MRKGMYFFALLFVVFSVIGNMFYQALNNFPPYVSLFFSSMAIYFGHPIPAVWRMILPYMANTALYFVLIALLVRRVIFVIRSKSLMLPASFSTLPQILIFISLLSLILMIGGMVISFYFQLSSGVPAALFGVPAAFLLVPTIVWVELKSLFAR